MVSVAHLQRRRRARLHGLGDRDRGRRRAPLGGVLFEDGAYTPIVDAELSTETSGEDRYHDRIRCLARTAEREIEITGKVRSLIPLRHRREAA